MPSMPSLRIRLAQIALASFSLLGLEIAWTRIFSGEFFYTFAFLILSLAILGLGLGGLALRLFPRLFRPDLLGVPLLVTALLALAGPPLVLHLGLDFARLLAGWAMAWRLALALGLLASAFCAGGLVLSLLFRAHAADMPRLYRADLAGAALGVGGVVLLMNTVGTPRATVLLVLPLLGAAFLAGGRRIRIASVLLGAGCLALLPFSARLLAMPRRERAPVVHRQWDATALVKVLDGGDHLVLNIDNAANTPITPFDGDWAKAAAQPSEFLADPRPLLEGMGGTCRFLSLGSGGGGDVLMALLDRAREVHAVEVNPAINRMLLPGGRYAAYSGNLYQDHRVRVHTEDARTYVRRHPGAFDMIYSFSSNSFAAMASGAFAMAENYLFTSEAFRDDWRALTPRGYLVMEHQFYVPRLVSEALDGLRLAGVRDPERHLAVFASPATRRQILLVGREPLSPAALARPFLALDEHDPKVMHRVFPDPGPGADPLVGRIVREGWRRVPSRTDLSPATDDRPFTALQGRLGNLSPGSMKALEGLEIRGFPAARLTILAVLAVVILLILPLNLLPALGRGPRLRAPAWAYFLVIGVAFMALEVVLIQKYTRFIGSSATTVAVILFTLLMGCGLGSRLAPRVSPRTPFLGILAWLALEILVLGRVTDALGGLPLPLRTATAMLCLLPLGLFMGMPFPKGTARVGACIDWGFAINGAGSVLGSAGIMLVSFQWGFTVALALGGALYLLAMALLARPGEWVRA